MLAREMGSELVRCSWRWTNSLTEVSSSTPSSTEKMGVQKSQVTDMTGGSPVTWTVLTGRNETDPSGVDVGRNQAAAGVDVREANIR